MKIKVFFGSILFSCLSSFACGIHYIADAEVDLLSKARHGCFEYTNTVKSLVSWADEDGLYERCGVHDVAHLAHEDIEAILGDMRQMLSATETDGFVAALKKSVPDQEIVNKVLVITHACLVDSQ